jgi:hypothetical protein
MSGRGHRSGDRELLVAEVGDELQGAPEGGDEPVEDILGGDMEAWTDSASSIP